MREKEKKKEKKEERGGERGEEEGRKNEECPTRAHFNDGAKHLVKVCREW